MFKRRGFTLVELLVVLVVIGILVALILPNALRAIHQTNQRECLSNIRSINTAIQMFYNESAPPKVWPTTQADLCGPPAFLADNNANGVGDWPVCPFGTAYAIVAAATGVGTECTPHVHP